MPRCSRRVRITSMRCRCSASSSCRAAIWPRRCVWFRRPCSCGRSRRRCLLNHGLVLNAMNRHRGGAGELRRRRSSTRAASPRRSTIAAACWSRWGAARRRWTTSSAPSRSSRTTPTRSTIRATRSRSSTATTRRSRATTAPSRCGRTTPRPHCNRGSVLDLLGRPADALVCYDRALAIAPDFAEAMHNRCGALRALKRVDEALQSLDRLLAMHPDYAEAHCMRAMTDGGLQPSRRSAGELREGGRAQARLQQGALGRLHGGAADPLRRREPRSPRSRADYERRLRALRARLRSRIASRAICPRGWAPAQPFFLAYQGQNDRELQGLFGGLASRIMADRYGTAEIAPPPAAGRADPRRHRQRLFLSAFGLEDRRQRLGHSARSEALPGVRLLHRRQAGRRDRGRPPALPPLRAGAALDRALAADHPGRPAACAASFRTSA